MSDKLGDVPVPLVVLDVLSQLVAKKMPEMNREHLIGISEEEKIHRAKYINESVPLAKEEYDAEYVENALLKAMCILDLLGYKDTAREVNIARRTVRLTRTHRNLVINHVTQDAIKKHRSISASGSRHIQKDEIIDVIKETWSVFPWGSRTRMIKYILAKYRVVEKTLKVWMKEEGLAPRQQVENKRYNLVFPEKWKK
ncbi:hypothetical protein ERD95_20060 [Enterobacteriaceae bacterium ML5]|nr:hypothetical protein ERD95_20060 [Enterobacteriaceae bacterium ML5]